MADPSSSQESEAITPPEITRDRILGLDDPYFTGDHVTVVTGAGSGVGQATAVVMAANGLTVAATDIDGEGLSETVEKSEELDVEGVVNPIEANLADDTELEQIVEEAAGMGSIKYVANIAGMQHISPIDEFPMEKYDLMHNVMLRAPLYLSKLCIPHIRESKDGTGAIGNMSSVHGHITTQDKVAYNITKFGLRGLTQSIAAEGEGTLRAFTISTAYVKTPLVTDQIPDTAQERGISEREVVEDVMLGHSRVKQMMEPVDVGNLFAFGFSRYSRHLNGGDLLYDGGMVLTYE